MSDSIHDDMPEVKRDTMQPHGDRVLLRMEKPKQKGAILIPDSVKSLDNCWYGTVLAKGKGEYADNIPLGASVMIEKMFKMTGGMEGMGMNGIDCGEQGLDGKGCMLLDADKILAVVE
jgi:co-chaperonin GroES (HSP10)